MWDLLALSLLRVRTTLMRNFLFKERTVIPILEYKCCYINNYSEIFQVFFFFLVIYGILNQSNEQKLIQSGIKFSQKKIMQLFSALFILLAWIFLQNMWLKSALFCLTPSLFLSQFSCPLTGTHPDTQARANAFYCTPRAILCSWSLPLSLTARCILALL